MLSFRYSAHLAAPSRRNRQIPCIFPASRENSQIDCTPTLRAPSADGERQGERINVDIFDRQVLVTRRMSAWRDRSPIVSMVCRTTVGSTHKNSVPTDSGGIPFECFSIENRIAPSESVRIGQFMNSPTKAPGWRRSAGSSKHPNLLARYLYL